MYDVADSPGEDHPMTLQVYNREAVKPMKGGYETGLLEATYGGWQPTWTRSNGNMDHLDLGSPNNDAVATRALARSNPSRPSVSLPNYILELREIPSLVKLAGDDLIEFGSSSFLAYQFGWAPLLKDMYGLFNYSSAVAKRAAELDQLDSRGGLRRKVVDRTYQAQASSQGKISVLDGALGDVCEGAYSKVTRRHIWSTVRWRPTGVRSLLDDRAARNQALARKAVLGIDLSDPGTIGAAAWNAIPWSWAIDYFGTISDWYQANGNSVPAEHGKVNVMTFTETVVDYRITKARLGISMDPGTLIHTTKSRDVKLAPVLTGDMPFLSARQVGILASLAIVRTKFAQTA
jgi:hypothetical protein